MYCLIFNFMDGSQAKSIPYDKTKAELRDSLDDIRNAGSISIDVKLSGGAELQRVINPEHVKYIDIVECD